MTLRPGLLVATLLVGLLLTACRAEQLTAKALPLSVVYHDSDGKLVSLIWRNMTEKPFTLAVQFPITRVTTVDGVEVQRKGEVKWSGQQPPLLPDEEQVVTIAPAIYYDCAINTPYLVTVTCHIQEANSDISYTFPYVVRATKHTYHTFTGEWAPVIQHPGLKARLQVVLDSDTRTSEVTVEYHNTGVVDAIIYDRALLDADVRRIGDNDLLNFDSVVRSGESDGLKTLPLPHIATIHYPARQYDGHDTLIPAGCISFWIGMKQYLFRPGERYRINAKARVPPVDGTIPLDTALSPLEITVPPIEPAQQAVRVSVQYPDAGPLQLHFSNTQGHQLQFTGEVIAVTDLAGKPMQVPDFPYSTTLTLASDNSISAHEMRSFALFSVKLTPGKWYLLTGEWKLQDKVTKETYTVSLTFPYLEPQPAK